MVRFVAISVIVGVAVLLLQACGEQAGDTTGEAGAKTWTVAVIPKGNSHEFWQSVKAGAAKADAELADISVDFKGPATENDLTQQKELFELNLTKGVDAVAIAPVDGSALGAVIDSAKGQGIPVVVFDSSTTAETYASFIATDNYAAGRKAGEEMVRRLGESGKVVVLRYKVGSASTEKREQGFLDVIGEHPGITVISDDQEGAGKEKEVSQNLLLKFGDQATGVYTPNESTTTGMMLAMRESGAYAKGVVHVGFDSTSEIVTSIQDGEIAAVVVQNPVQMGYLTVTIMHDILSGKPVEKTVDTGSELVTRESLEKPEIRSLLGIK